MLTFKQENVKQKSGLEQVNGTAYLERETRLHVSCCQKFEFTDGHAGFILDANVM